jgi:EpsI family protein
MKRQHFFLLAGILVCQAVIYYGFAQHEVIPKGAAWNSFPNQVGTWSVDREMLPDEASLAQLQPDDYLSRDYVKGPDHIDLFVAYFKTQRTGHAPHSPKACLPGAGWDPVSEARLPISVPQSSVTIDANQYVVRRAGVEMAVFYWYQTARRTIANEYMFQVYAIPELLSHGRTDVAFIRVITEITNGLDNARNTALDFIRQAFPAVQSHIPVA